MPSEGVRRLELELQVVVGHLMWCWEQTQVLWKGSVHTVDHWALSLAPDRCTDTLYAVLRLIFSLLPQLLTLHGWSSKAFLSA